MVKLRDNSGHVAAARKADFSSRFQREMPGRPARRGAFSLPILNSPLVE